MRLRKVVLAGFKSFVDPTTIEFPSDLVGIVGPNGCGKSNVIDAVRWVMGEISARHLRGGSMADVIFNGSTARKPVGQASVELVFDNSDGRLGERYAAYTDISVRRQVAREGASSYFLNGSRCRRRDVTDLFLGTGLGPRSYAVIEQGMISRIVEARPEELRDYLEEVAGISRYKERRRETENRIRHTREHLERLTDVREELGKQLARLERQAKQAERYKVLKAEEDQLEVQLLALQWGRLDDEAQRRAQSVEGNSTAVEGVTAQLRHLEALIEQVRAEQGTAAEAANDAYRAVLDASAEVARTEETIDGLGRQRQAVEDGMRREQSAFEEAKAHLSGSEAQLAELRENLRTGEPHFARLEEEMASARDRFGDSERRMHEWQAGWEDLARRVREPAEVAHAERARIESLEERIQRITDRRRKLDADASEIDVGAAEQALAQATEAELATEVAQEAADTGLESAADGMRETRAQGEASSRDLHDARAALMQLQSTHASLTALQRDAMDGADVAVTRWLADTGLAEAGRLVESIRVDDGWSRAVETILDTLLEAIAVENLDGAAEHFGSLQGGPLAIVATHVEGPAEAGDSRDDGLANRVHSPAVVRQLLVGARTVESLDSALRQRQSLAHGEFFVTPEGVTVSRNLLRQPRPGQAEDGVIARAQRIRLLAEELAVSEARLSSAEEAQGAAEARRRDAEAALAQAQAAANEAHRQHSIAVAQKNTSARAVDAVNERSGRLIAEREENAARRVVALEELKAGRSKLTAAAEALGAVEAERNAWSASRDELRNALERSRDEWQRLRDEGYQLGLKVEGWRTRVAGLEESNVRYARELTRLETHCVELRSQFEA
ncbi:MAG: chromosome segregation protein SMC, partial [Chromatiales bacterium]|nr:chromosome segregation protein SMC [Chromatiales bacterium]